MRPWCLASLLGCTLLLALVGCGGGEEGGDSEQVEAAIAAELGGSGGRASVSTISIEGDRARAEVAFDGGGLDGQAIAVRLVERDGRWRLARIVGFAEYDPRVLARALEARFEAASSQLTAAQIECLGEAIRASSRVEAEALLLVDSPRLLTELAAGCG